MPGLLDLLAPLLSGKGLDPIGRAAGLDRASTERGVDAALPAILTRLRDRADDPSDGPALAAAVAKDHSGAIFDDLGSLVGRVTRGDATSGALGTIFGKEADDPSSGPLAAIASTAALDGGQAKSLLGVLAPLVLGALGKAGGAGATAAGLSSLLRGALGQLGTARPTQLLAGLPGASTDAGAKVAGAKVAGAAAAGAAATAGAARVAAADAATGFGARTSRRPAWLWLVGGLVLVALLGFLLARCSSDDDATSADTTAAATEAVATEAVATEAVATDAPATEAPATLAAAPATDAAPTNADVLAAAATRPDLSLFGQAVTAAGLTDTLHGPGPFTLFAPTDDAFRALPAGALDALLQPANKDLLATILNHHVAPSRIEGDTLVTGDVPTAGGSTLALAVDGTTVTVADSTGPANVVGAPVASGNGLVYGIDRVLLPAGVTLPGTEAPATTVPATNAAGDATPEGLTVYFDTASAAIRASEQPKIAGAVETLKALPAGSKVDVIGHADSRGDAAKNRALSERRAQAVLDALKAGVGDTAANITFTVGAKGDTEQAADLDKSRRVTIEIK